MSTSIAQTAVVDPRARIGRDVQVGHFCIIGPDVVIGEGTKIESHTVISGITTIGINNHIFSHCVFGTHPQDTGYRDTPTRVQIGDNNIFREHCTVNRATEKQDCVTRIGSDNYLMTGCHVAHDCDLGDRIVLANNAMLGGHVRVGNDVTLAGGVGVNHFASIGQLSFVSAMSRVLHDVPPYMIVDGSPAKPRACNTVGLKRHDYPQEDIDQLSKAFKLLYRRRVGIQAARRELLGTGPLRPALKHLFDSLAVSASGQKGRGLDQRRKAA